MKYANILAALYGSAWAIDPRALSVIEGVMEDHLSGELSDEEVGARASSRSYGSVKAEETSESIRVIPLHGPIMNRAGAFSRMSGMTSPQHFAEAVRQATADPAVKHIVLDIDSPGGTVSGTATAAEAVRDARGVKPVIAVANDMMASAAYWIGSQATKIVGGAAATVGSVGVIWPHRDLTGAEAMVGQKTTYIRSSRDKALGQPFEPLSDEVRAFMQEEVDNIAQVFRAEVGAARGLDPEYIEKEWSASTRLGEDALEVGMIDEIGTLETVIASLKSDTEMPQNMTATTTDSGSPASTADVATTSSTAVISTAEEALEPVALEDAESRIQELEAQLAIAQQVAEEAMLEKHTAKVEALVEDALATGRALPSMKDWLTEQATTNFDFVQGFIESLPAGCVTPAGGKRLTPTSEDREGTLSSSHVRKFLESREKASARFQNPLRAVREIA